MPGTASTGAWADRVADAVPFARRLPGFGALAGLTGALPPPPAPQPFSLPCACGATVTGTRSEREREEPCMNCGEPHFVLPADTYPAPPAERTAVAKPRRKSKATEPKKSPAEPVAPAAPRMPWRTRLAAGVRRRASPLRLIAVGLAVVVAGTAWWGVAQSRRTAARMTIAEAPAAATEALSAGRFAAAAERFDALAAAYETLGRADEPRALAARQNAREATAAAGLASQTPVEIARQAAAVRTAADRSDWHGAFDALYRGRWVILETHAARVPAPILTPTTLVPAEAEEKRTRPDPLPDRVELLHPLAIAGARFRLIGDPAVPGDLATGDDPRPVALAGRYGACVEVPDGRGGTVWELRLEPGSAFLWTGAETLAAVGFDLEGADGAALRRTLARQAATLGLDANPEPDELNEPTAPEADR